MPAYNKRSPAVRRILQEVKELAEPTDQYAAAPLEENIFEWHFTIRGPPGSDFEGGRYHGRITLPNDYPMKPPSIMMLTANGRFEVGRKICLSVSDFHPESWRPSWSIRTVLVALIGFMPTPGNGAIAALDYTPQERKVLAEKSRGWRCPECDACSETALQDGVQAPEMSSEDREALEQLSFKGEQSKSRTTSECPPSAAGDTPAAPAAETADRAAAELTGEPVNQSTSVSANEQAVRSPAPAVMPSRSPSAAGTGSPQRTRLARSSPSPPRKIDWTFNLFIGALLAAILALVVRKMQASDA